MSHENLIDNFDIKEWASSKIYRRGMEYFREGRVASFELDDDNTIRAEVEGIETYNVEISWSDDGEPVADCACPYDWEPICKHAVAAILYWQESGDDLPESEEEDVQDHVVNFNREEYIAELAGLERKKRASKKLLESVRILKKPKGGLYGEYLITSGTASLRYTVTVRDVTDVGQTTCDCQDFLVNELGTCKHIELVKAYIGKQKKRGTRTRRKDKNVWISVVPKDSYNGLSDPYEEIHIHASDPDISKKIPGHFQRTDPQKSAIEQFSSALNAINFISTNCIEERVYAAVQNKKALFDGLFDGQTDSVVFEKSSSFIDRLRDMIDDKEDACNGEAGVKDEGRRIDEDLDEQLGAADGVNGKLVSTTEGTAVVENGDSAESGRKEIDVTSILKGLGAWIGNSQITNCPDGALKVGVEHKDGEIKLSLRRPPAELVLGLKNALKGFADMFGG